MTPMAPSTAPPRRALVLGRAVVGLLAATFVVAGLVQAWTDSPTVDEGVDLAAGLTAWVHHDLRMAPEHPPLPQLLAAAPALAAQPVVPRGEAWSDGDWFAQTDAVLAANDDAGRLRRVVFLSRLVPLVEALACGAVAFLLARRLAGEAAGLLAAGLWFTPFTLGLGHVQSIDIAFTLATLIVALTLVRHSEHPTLRRASVVGVALAAGLATRHTGIVLVPVALLAVGVAARGDRDRVVRQVLLTAVVGYVGLWLAYRGVDLTAPGGAPGARFDGLIGAASGDSVLARVVLAVPAPLEWRAGFAYLTETSDPRAAYLFGQMWEGTRWWFFPGSLVVKVIAPAVLVLVTGPLAWRSVEPARRTRGALCVALPALVLFAVTAIQPLALGLRLVLPSLALWMVLAGVAGPWLLQRAAGRWALGALAVVQVVALLTAGAHSLPWTAPPFRPPDRYVSSGNVDFGQDLWRVREWSAGRDPWVAVLAPRGLTVGGTTRDLVDADPAEVTGWAAVGVTPLTVTQRDALSWLRRYCPVGTLGGGSVLIYRFEDPPTPAPGPDRPVPHCTGAASSHEP